MVGHIREAIVRTINNGEGAALFYIEDGSYSFAGTGNIPCQINIDDIDSLVKVSIIHNAITGHDLKVYALQKDDIVIIITLEIFEKGQFWRITPRFVSI